MPPMVRRAIILSILAVQHKKTGAHGVAMIKKIGIGQLKVGMFVHDLCCDWMNHPFMRSRLLISSEAEISRIIDAGIHELYIDTDKGLDATDAPTEQEVKTALEHELLDIAARQTAPVKRVSVAEEI